MIDRRFAVFLVPLTLAVSAAGCSGGSSTESPTTSTTTTGAPDAAGHDMENMQPGETMPTTTHDMESMQPGESMP